MNYVPNTENQAGLRVRALGKLVVGLGTSIGAYVFIIKVAKSGGTIHAVEYFLFVPFTYGCTGGVELVTGKPFQQVTDSWSRLASWQRGVLSLIFILFGSALIISLVWFLFRSAK